MNESEPSSGIAEPEGQSAAATEAGADWIEAIRSGLLAWFRGNARDLPWRHTRDPYRVLVSEVMLQQTQVDRVIPYYEAFLGRFLTVEALAAAPTAEVIRLWAGLGYNRRAVNLQRTAQAVVERGGWPTDPEGLRSLPGIGPYTAGAVACFAFEQDVAFIDTNMRRVVHRLRFGPDLPTPLAGERAVLETAARLVPPERGWEWNQALIEFGALHCTARKPACVVCPLQRSCRAYPAIQSIVASLPRGTRKKIEAPFAGSNRYYRGRVLDALRSVPPATSTGIDLRQLGPRVREGFAETDVPWLRTVVDGLARDGLAVIAEERPPYDAADPGAARVRLPD
ncbi:MAG: A/G-specific adenine glycosylase [Chloroflexia bacterium]|nr:A/G-specific adenine glycosylase [Chloroflexia bacterium]